MQCRVAYYQCHNRGSHFFWSPSAAEHVENSYAEYMQHMKWSNSVSWLDCEIQPVAGRGKQNLTATSTFSSVSAANSPQGLNDIALAS